MLRNRTCKKEREREREMDGWIESRGVGRREEEGMIMCANVKESESE